MPIFVDGIANDRLDGVLCAAGTSLLVTSLQLRDQDWIVEIRSFEGCSQELSDFVSSVWQATYRNRMPIPLWTAPFFEWQITSIPSDQRMYCLAAYDGGRLAGTLLGEEFQFRWHGQLLRGSQGSWLTVDPAYRGKQVARQLVDELRHRHQQRDAQFQIGYGYQGSVFSLGPKFWKKTPADTVTPGALGFWVRVLDAPAVASWELNRMEGLGARAIGWVQRRPDRWEIDPNVRNFRPGDLNQCLSLVTKLTERSDVSLVWNQERLLHQLAGCGFPRTMVFEVDGVISGLVNYHILDYVGQGRIPVGLIDLLAVGELAPGQQLMLLRGALKSMQQEGACLAMILRTPCFPARPLLFAGFVPRLADQAILLTKMNAEFEPGRPRSFHVLWR